MDLTSLEDLISTTSYRGGHQGIDFFLDALYSDSDNGKLIRLNLQYSQLEAGIGQDLLEFPDIHISYLTPTWILSLRQYLSLHKMSVTVSDTYQIPLRSPSSDAYIMQASHLEQYTNAQQKDSNLVRLFLQVNTLADITDCSNPKAISLFFLDGRRPPSFKMNKQWPRQQTPTKSQVRLWKGYVKSSFLRYVPYWKTAPLPSSQAPTSVSVPTPSTFDSLIEYLSSLPQSSRRLIDEIDQTATDFQVWKSFSSKKRLYVATDGGLLRTQGTHGWVVANGSKVLFRCAGPVDGPHDTSSSTRCELSGYASALLFIDHLSRFWGIRHKCKFTWKVCDNKVAISRVRRFASRHPSRRMPPDADLILIIRTHQAPIRGKIKHRWITGHQDSLSIRTLSVLATLNIEADSLASGYRSNGSLKSRPGCEHVQSQQCSISVNRQRLTSQFDECIRYHVNGYHLAFGGTSRRRKDGQTSFGIRWISSYLVSTIVDSPHAIKLLVLNLFTISFRWGIVVSNRHLSKTLPWACVYVAKSPKRARNIYSDVLHVHRDHHMFRR